MNKKIVILSVLSFAALGVMIDLHWNDSSIQESSTMKITISDKKISPPETPMCKISGRVALQDGTGVSGILMLATGKDAQNKTYNTATLTDTNGNYTVTVPKGWTGDLAPDASGTKTLTLPEGMKGFVK